MSFQPAGGYKVLQSTTATTAATAADGACLYSNDHTFAPSTSSSSSSSSPVLCFSPWNESVSVGNAFDLIVVRRKSSSPLSSPSSSSSCPSSENRPSPPLEKPRPSPVCSIACSDAIVSFGTAFGGGTTAKGMGAVPMCGASLGQYLEDERIVLEVDCKDRQKAAGYCAAAGGVIVNGAAAGERLGFQDRKILFPIVGKTIQKPEDESTMEERLLCMHNNDDRDSDGDALRIPKQPRQEHHDERALTELVANLLPGCNSARYLLLNEEGKIKAVAPCNIFLWSDQEKIICFDIDGTITRSNIRGIIDTILTEQYSYCHDGVCRFLSSLRNVRIVYVTSRPITIANTTRKFLSELRQEVDSKLPAGPLIGFPGTLAEVLMMELVSHSVHKFKASALKTNVLRPFADVGVKDVFLAGFGNTPMDLQAYHAVGMNLSQIYFIDKQSQIFSLDSAQAPAQPQRRHEYLQARGTLFRGYTDATLLRHVLKHASLMAVCTEA